MKVGFIGLGQMGTGMASSLLRAGHGGGRWYNFRAESAWGHGKDYRHLLVHLRMLHLGRPLQLCCVLHRLVPNCGFANAR